jgi:methyltransferase-like protein
VLAASVRPTAASPLARLQAATNATVTNRRHRLVALNPFDRLLLPHLDGSRDRAALLDVLMGLAARKVLTVAETDSSEVRAALDAELMASLDRLARSALLVR